MKDSLNLILVFALVLTTVVAETVVLTAHHFDPIQRELDYYKQTYLHKIGSTCLWTGSKGEYVNYQLFSMDAGKHWYAYTNENNGVKILGNVDDVFSGLLKHIQSMDALMDQVTKNGPLNLSRSNDVELLKTVGFTITTNK